VLNVNYPTFWVIIQVKRVDHPPSLSDFWLVWTDGFWWNVGHEHFCIIDWGSGGNFDA